MEVSSIGYQTDLIFTRFDGIIKDRGEYLVVISPLNPNFHWGNFLLFKHPPTEKSFKQWRDLFQKEFASYPEVHHQTFGWDSIHGEQGEVQEFIKAGYVGKEDIVYTASQLKAPPFFNSNITVRPFETEKDWQDIVENDVINRDPMFTEESYRSFKVNQMQRYRAMQKQNLGHWFGAFLGHELVGGLGIFKQGQLGRFQNVGVNDEHRRKGICGTLVYKAAQFALKDMGITQLVMVTETDGQARRVYESVGFMPQELQFGLSWWPKNC